MILVRRTQSDLAFFCAKRFTPVCSAKKNDKKKNIYMYMKTRLTIVDLFEGLRLVGT